MKHAKSVLATAVGMVLALGQSAASAEEMVYDYVRDSSGKVVSDGSGDCVRTTFKDSRDYREECGYKLVIEKAADVSSAPTGTAVVILEKATIVKGDKVVAESGVLVEEIIINNVQFEFDKAELTPEYRAMLDNASELLKPHRSLLRQGLAVLNVIGYTDSKGPEAYNQKLSERRAKTVADYLIAQDPSRAAFTRTIGRGEADPLASNDTAEGQRLNRRVVLQVIGK